MSHFTVGVICKKLEEFEDLLAPYQENNMGDCPKEFLEFTSITKEEKEKYETGTSERFVTKGGEYIYPFDERFKVRISKEEYEQLEKSREVRTWGGFGDCFKFDYSIIEGELRQVPYKELYSTFEDYMEACDYELDKEMNDYGYWENPNAKWDWYDVGGRWSKCVPLKNGDHCDYAQLKDICLGVEPVKYREEERFWEIVVEGQPLQDGEEKPFNWRSKEWFLQTFKDKNDYATQESTFRTFALITPDGEWFERGEMGWWGIDTADKDSIKDFNTIYDEVVRKEEYQDYWFVLVDCHI